MKILKILFAILITAQLTHAQKIDLGVKIGANFSTLSDVSGFDNKTGFNAGFFVGTKISKIGLQAELLYSRQGAEFEDSDIDLDYINVPVLLKYYLIGGLNVQLGPQFGFLIDDNLPNLLETKSFDLSGAAGLGVDLPFGLRADVRYVFGLTDVFENSDGKNGNFTLAIGYSFL
ncbi:porin family protein [Flavobacterium sp. CS20]|uniref:porin family protein n=1 Tax=Flavobacterium sp. CS20 TaxID=2775246 RepID=UPI001B3A1DA0|nr:porin family protein [Flavobacterium sp. CS20]QTY25851.1 PorT family protein [Flavobacterium sp. CS20]